MEIIKCRPYLFFAIYLISCVGGQNDTSSHLPPTATSNSGSISSATITTTTTGTTATIATRGTTGTTASPTMLSTAKTDSTSSSSAAHTAAPADNPSPTPSATTFTTTPQPSTSTPTATATPDPTAAVANSTRSVVSAQDINTNPPKTSSGSEQPTSHQVADQQSSVTSTNSDISTAAATLLTNPSQATTVSTLTTDTSTEPSTTEESNPDVVLWPHYKTSSNRTSLEQDFPRIYRPGIPFSYFKNSSTEIHVHPNGYVSFGFIRNSDIAPKSTEWPFSPALFAVYWADIDTSENNQSGLYIVEDKARLENATVESSLIRYVKRVVNVTKYEPLYALAITWENVMPRPAKDHPNETATFQLILATDTHLSFAIRNYQTVWSKTNKNGIPYYISTSYTDIDGGEHTGVTLTGNESLVVKLFDLGDYVDQSAFQCVKITQNVTSHLLTSIQSLPACPCYRIQAQNDGLFQLYPFDGNENICYRSISSSEQPLAQRCCYDKYGLFVTDPYFAQTPIQTNNETILDDAYEQCCIKTNEMCYWFWEQIPVSNCSNYVAPYIAAGFGDPHIVTFDNNKYTFNELGAFVLFRSGDNTVELQGRTQITSGSDTTFFQSYALRTGNGLYLFSLDNNTLLLNGTKQSLGAATVTYSTYSFTVKYMNGFLSHMVQLRRLDNGSEGLLGSLDENPANDLKFRDGTIVDDEDQSGRIFNELANDWRVNETEYLFGDWSQYNKNIQSNFAPSDIGSNVSSILKRFNDSVEEEKARELCGDELFCLQDYFIHHSNESALEILGQSESIDLLKNISNEKPYFVNMSSSIFVGNLSGFTLELKVQRTTPLTLTIEGDDLIKRNSILENDIFTWNISRSLGQLRSTVYPLKLAFYATNGKNLSVQYAPTINLCLCDNPEQCEKQEETSDSEEAYVLNNNGAWIGNVNNIMCNCGNESRGKYCEINIDVCTHCFNQTACDSSQDNICGECPHGYNGDGKYCFDIDECVIDNDGCEQICINEPGTSRCSCGDGYHLNYTKCIDIDECLDKNGGCTTYCNNTDGGYHCLCDPGYRLSWDDKTCENINECEEDLDFCNNSLKHCTDLPGSAHCACLPSLVGKENCFRALHTFIGSVELAVAGNQSFDYDLLNTASDKFKELGDKVADSITEALLSGNVGSEDTLYVETLSFEPYNQTDNTTTSHITAQFGVFTSDLSITADRLNTALYNFSSNCTIKLCPFGSLILVSSVPSIDEKADLCKYPAIHKCDESTTQCQKHEYDKNGTYCECLGGYTESDINLYSCQDINECAVNASAYCPGGDVCENFPGGYRCVCSQGRVWNSSVKACVANKCMSNPCKNDGTCSLTSDNEGFICSCTYGWNGPDCGNEDTDARQMKIAVICVSVVLGFCCFTLFIVVVVLCLRQRNVKNGGYNYIGEDKTASQTSALNRPNSEMAENHQGNMYSQLGEERGSEKRTSFARRSSSPDSKKTGTTTAYYNKVYDEDDEEVQVRL